jgi:hypothetical protein
VTIYNVSNMMHDSGGGWDGQNNYGPLAVGAGYKITKIRCTGSVAWAGIGTLTDSEYLITPLCWGIQYGPAGYGTYPLGDGADYEDYDYFDGGVFEPSPSIANWAPSTDTAALLDRYAYDFEIYPQYLVPSGGVDIYFSLSPFITPLSNFYNFGSFRVWYHG